MQVRQFINRAKVIRTFVHSQVTPFPLPSHNGPGCVIDCRLIVNSVVVLAIITSDFIIDVGVEVGHLMGFDLSLLVLLSWDLLYGPSESKMRA